MGKDVTEDDIFYFVYGQLHDPGCREAYAADLKKMLPHIQTPADRARFDQLVDDRSTLVYNTRVTVAGIPLEADENMLGARSALAWIIGRYQVKKNKASGIINDPTTGPMRWETRATSSI